MAATTTPRSKVTAKPAPARKAQPERAARSIARSRRCRAANRPPKAVGPVPDVHRYRENPPSSADVSQRTRPAVNRKAEPNGCRSASAVTLSQLGRIFSGRRQPRPRARVEVVDPGAQAEVRRQVQRQLGPRPIVESERPTATGPRSSTPLRRHRYRGGEQDDRNECNRRLCPTNGLRLERDVPIVAPPG